MTRHNRQFPATWELRTEGRMVQRISIDNETLYAEILPGTGGGLARLDIAHGGQRISVLRPSTPGADLHDPDQLACYPLVPWSNRIRDGRFVTDGRVVTLAANRSGERYPLHGYGWQSEWRVVARSADAVTLELDCTRAVPFTFVARMRYALSGAGLAVRLEVTNRGPTSMPFGLGLHPWFPRTAGVRLQAPARGVWIAGADGLPATHVPVPASWDFTDLRPLPADRVDNAFSDWNGSALLSWPESGVAVKLRADGGYYVLYAPAGKNFFCFEPVDHPPNAHNLPGGAVRNGLTELAAGASFAREFSFDVSVLPASGAKPR